jgi:hypothetical protein
MDELDIIIREKVSTEKIEIPEHLEENINKVLEKLPEKAGRRNNFRRNTFAAGISAAMIVLSFTVAYANNVPLANSIVDFFKGNSSLIYSGDTNAYEKYANGVGKTIIYNGVSVTIDNIACDNNFLVLFYTVSGQGKNGVTSADGITLVNGLFGDISIDGKRKPYSNNDNSDAYVTNDGKIKGMIRADVSGIDLPDNFKVDFNASLGRSSNKDGDWHFKFEVAKSDAMKDTKLVKVDKKVHIEYTGREHNITIEKVSLTPFGNQISISEKFAVSEKSSKADGAPIFNSFALFDEKGNSLDVLDNQLMSMPDKAINSFEFVKGDKNIKSITFVPIRQYGDTEKKEIDYSPVVSTNKFPLELKMSSKGSLKVTRIEYGDTDTKIYYTREGVVLGPVSFSLVDDNGKSAYENVNFLYKDYIVDRKQGIHATVLPKVDRNKKYKLGYYTDEKFDLLNQYKVVIPME